MRHDDTIKYYYVDGNATQAGPVFLPDLQNMCARAKPGHRTKTERPSLTRAQASPVPAARRGGDGGGQSHIVLSWPHSSQAKQHLNPIPYRDSQL